MSRATRNDVVRKAENLGLEAAIGPHGDGPCSFFFYGKGPYPESYKKIAEVLGAKQAMIWLDGFEASRKTIYI